MKGMGGEALGTYRRFAVAAAAVLGLAAALASCKPGKHPFLIVQICLGDAENLALFKREMRAIAESEELEFMDASAATRTDLGVIDAQNIAHSPDGPVIDIDIARDDGLGAGASNLGLPGYQVAIGFSEGSIPAEARDFAGRVISRLARHWPVDTVAAGEGAQPMRNCSNTPPPGQK